MNPAARQVKVNLSGMLEFGSVISGNGYRPECRLVSVDEERIPASVGEHLGTCLLYTSGILSGEKGGKRDR